MSDIRELYQQVILDHGRKPRCLGVMSNPTLMKQGFNPLCGDRLTLYIQASEGKITDVSFDGDGCAISMASASLMAEAIKGMSIEEEEEEEKEQQNKEDKGNNKEEKQEKEQEGNKTVERKNDGNERTITETGMVNGEEMQEKKKV